MPRHNQDYDLNDLTRDLPSRVQEDMALNSAIEMPSCAAERIAAMLNTSVCNFFAVAEAEEVLANHGFTELDPAAGWKLLPGGRYYMKRNDTALFAFVCGTVPPPAGGFHIIASHSDSPGFKLKPNPEIYGDGGVVSLNVEKYGGPIMYTWFDRPLSIAARLMLRGDDPLHPVTRLVDLINAVAVIPHLAIHFNRAVNDGNPLSVQKDMKPVMGYMSVEEFNEKKARGGVVKCLLADEAGVEPEDILAYEAVLYPVDSVFPGVGYNEDYIVSPRLDDLSMAFASLCALTETCGDSVRATRLMAIFDNEETGSGTRQGAAAPTLRNLMHRICASYEEEQCPAEESMAQPADSSVRLYRALERTFMISADDAHAWHPNYPEKYDPTNHPVLGGGPVVKINANCKYMTDADSAAVFRTICAKAGVPVQTFVNHSDVAGGSTLGNILTSQLPLRGVDMGAPQWAMHSCRETAAVADHLYIHRAFATFLSI